MERKKIVNLRLAVFIALSFIFGILSAKYFLLSNIAMGIVFIFVFIALYAVFLFLTDRVKDVKASVIITALLVCFFLLGYVSMHNQVTNYIDADLNNHYFNVSGKVLNKKQTDTGEKLIISNASVKGYVSGKLSYDIALYVYGETTADRGSIVEFEATILDNSYIYYDDINKYNIAEDIKYSANISSEDIKIVGKSLNVFEKCNLFIRESLKNGLDNNEFSVSYAMLTGDSDMIDYNVISSYRYMGVAHIFAVSGLHIGFLATAFGFLFDKLKIRSRRIVKAVCITLLLIFYSGVCGFTASSVRATVMSAVMLLLGVKGERYDGLSALSISAVIILLISPVQLFCVGFQLSYAVVLSILLLSGTISMAVNKLLPCFPKKLSSSIGTIISAQLAGIPISLACFGYFSPISVIANFLLIPIVSVVFILLIVLTFFGGVFAISHITLFPLNYLMKGLNALITVIDSDKLIISGIVLGAFSVFYYIAMIIPSGFLNIKFRTKLVSTIVATTIFFGGVIGVNALKKNQTYMLISGAETVCFSMLVKGDENVLVISDVTRIFSLSDFKAVKSKYGVQEIDCLILTGGYEYDMQVLVSRLLSVFDIENISYYGSKNTELELLMLRSFAHIKVNAYVDGEMLPLENVLCNYAVDGNAVNMTVNGKNLSVLSVPDGLINYTGIGKDKHLIVSGVAVGAVNSRFSPENMVSYRRSSEFLDGETHGVLKFSL